MSNIRRILVALDASPASVAAAAAAAELATLTDAEIHGIFVEDIELLEVARSPLGREIEFHAASFRRPEPGRLEQQLRALAARARRDLRRVAEGAGVNWSFRVARGSVASEISQAAREVDMVSLGSLGHSLRPRLRLGKTARALLAQPKARTLLLDHRNRVRSPTVVVFDGSARSEEALALALRLAPLGRELLSVLLLGEEERSLRDALAGAIGEREAGSRWIGSPPAEEIERAIRSSKPGLLILPSTLARRADGFLERLVTAADCPVLVIS